MKYLTGGFNVEEQTNENLNGFQWQLKTIKTLKEQTFKLTFVITYFLCSTSIKTSRSDVKCSRLAYLFRISP